LERKPNAFFFRAQPLTPVPRSMDFIVSKLKEKSTYAGLLALLSAAGLVIDPEQFGAIATVIVALVGAFEVFRKERP
jgi:hypothetical protein